MTISTERLEALDQITLDSGSHNDFADGHCAMEVVSWLADEGFTDAPSCASPVIRRYTIALNDRWDDEKRQTLKPYLVRMIGTGNDGKDEIRERIALRATIDLLVPWLRLANLTTQADALEALPATTSRAELRAAVRKASDAAWEIRSKRYALIREKVKEELAKHQPADADAAADADAVADAAADAAAAAAADAAAAAAADAAADAAAAAAADADAAADAVAVADAAAVAVAVAAASKASRWEKYDAAYAAARAYYREHPLPITEQAAALADEQRGAALALLDRLIDAHEEA